MRISFTAALFTAVLASLSISSACVANAADIRVFVTTAMKPAMQELGPAFEKEPRETREARETNERKGAKPAKHRLLISYGPSGALARRVAGNSAVDLVIVARGIDGLVKAGKVRGDSRRDLAKVGIGIAVKKGASRPDIGTADALKRTLLAAKSIAYVDPRAGGASGRYLVKMFERLGISKEIKAKAVLARGGTNDMVSAMVARGEAEIGLQQISEILSVSGVDLVGPLPGDLQAVTVYTAAIPAIAKQADAAEALSQFLVTPEVADIYKRKGLDPLTVIPPKPEPAPEKIDAPEKPEPPPQ
jgi:molybdate transport system substrate-binding protein